MRKKRRNCFLIALASCKSMEFVSEKKIETQVEERRERVKGVVFLN